MSIDERLGLIDARMERLADRFEERMDEVKDIAQDAARDARDNKDELATLVRWSKAHEAEARPLLDMQGSLKQMVTGATAIQWLGRGALWLAGAVATIWGAVEVISHINRPGP